MPKLLAMLSRDEIPVLPSNKVAKRELATLISEREDARR